MFNFNRVSIINHPFLGTPSFGNTHIALEPGITSLEFAKNSDRNTIEAFEASNSQRTNLNQIRVTNFETGHTDVAVEPKIGGNFPPNHPFVHRIFIGFSIIVFTIHFWGVKSPYFWKQPCIHQVVVSMIVHIYPYLGNDTILPLYFRWDRNH